MAKYEETIHTLQLPKASPTQLASITRHDILDCDGSAFILHNFLSPTECQCIVEQAEAIGMWPCGYKHSIRITDRMVAKSKSVAEMLFDRARPFLEPCIDLTDTSDASDSWPTGIPWTFPRCKWHPVGLNEVFRVCRYRPGGFFAPHHDGGYAQSESNRSILTFMIYLNDDFVGGATNFYNASQRHYRQGDPEKVVFSYQPRAGDALVFNSAITHDGGELKEGLKYIMRSEVMYSSLAAGEAQKDDKGFPPDHDDNVDFGPD